MSNEKIDLSLRMKNMMRIFLDSIRDYELENGSSISNDERESIEFVQIFIDSEDSFEFYEILKIYEMAKQQKQIKTDPALQIGGVYWIKTGDKDLVNDSGYDLARYTETDQFELAFFPIIVDRKDVKKINYKQVLREEEQDGDQS